MNQLGMMVDLSPPQVSTDTMKAALAISEAPVIFRTPRAGALVDNTRNVPEDILKGRWARKKGALVMVNFEPGLCFGLRNKLGRRPRGGGGGGGGGGGRGGGCGRDERGSTVAQ